MTPPQVQVEKEEPISERSARTWCLEGLGHVSFYYLVGYSNEHRPQACKHSCTPAPSASCLFPEASQELRFLALQCDSTQRNPAGSIFFVRLQNRALVCFSSFSPILAFAYLISTSSLETGQKHAWRVTPSLPLPSTLPSLQLTTGLAGGKQDRDQLSFSPPPSCQPYTQPKQILPF